MLRVEDGIGVLALTIHSTTKVYFSFSFFFLLFHFNYRYYSFRTLTIAAILYKGLGIDPKTILALAGVYGTVTFVSNAITTKFLTDQWGRRKQVTKYTRTNKMDDSLTDL